jgi:hypothetical protein
MVIAAGDGQFTAFEFRGPLSAALSAVAGWRGGQWAAAIVPGILVITAFLFSSLIFISVSR